MLEFLDKTWAQQQTDPSIDSNYKCYDRFYPLQMKAM